MKKDLRARILKTALRLFAQRGFFETTVDEITRSSRIAKGTFYLYFKDKSDIYIAIIEEQLNSALKDIAEVNARNLTNTEKLRSIAQEWLIHSVEFHRLFPMVSMENINQALKLMKGIKQRVFPIISKIILEISEIIKEGVERGEFKAVNPHIAALYYLNIIRIPFLSRMLTGKGYSSSDEILELYFNGLSKKGA